MRDGRVKEILLPMKKRGFGQGKYNGYGGKVNPGERIEDASIRELNEESGITASRESMKKVAELTFIFPEVPKEKGWDQLMHVYFITNWSGEPAESEEMSPHWFSLDSIPYDRMWPDDKHWLPLVLDGKFVTAMFKLGGDQNSIIEQKIETR